MKIRDVMTSPAIRIHPGEPVSVAARALEHYNIGVLPVCGSDGRLQGVVTDRDIVTRCLASERNPGQTDVAQIMTGQVLTVGPDASTAEAARLMGARQVRRLPVVENGIRCNENGDFALIDGKDMAGYDWDLKQYPIN